METLTSRTNDKIKLALSLRSDARERRKNGLFFLEGARLCEDAASCGIKIYMFLCTEKAGCKFSELCNTLSAQADSSYFITDSLSEYLSDTVMPQGLFCICKALDKSKISNKIDDNGKYVALDNIQNPDNLGAISRSAEALGISGLIISSGCDIYNPKALRASMGSLLRLHVIRTDDLPSLLCKCSSHGMDVIASVPDSSAEKITELSFDRGAVCAVGNEGNGLSDSVINACSKKVTIPMKGRTESLNASTAAAILIWEMTK